MVRKDNIVLFDGVCNLCNGFVNVLIRRDKDAKLTFASLQSEAAVKHLKELEFDMEGVDSVIFLKNRVIATKSDAVIEIFRTLGGVWKLAVVLYIIPVNFRNRIYAWVAKNRYLWFGKREACMIPNEDVMNRFL